MATWHRAELRSTVLFYLFLREMLKGNDEGPNGSTIFYIEMLTITLENRG